MESMALSATEKEDLMRTVVKSAIIGTLTIVSLGVAFVPEAAAQCAYPAWRKAGAVRPRSFRGVAQFSPVSFLTVANQEGSNGRIVGFWKVKFVSEGTSGMPDGTVIDNGFAQWHADGTEIMNSSRPSAANSSCPGVWQKSGPSSYELIHFAPASDPAGNPVGPVRIRELVTLKSNSDQYEGTFTIDQYDLSGKPLAHIAGRVTAMRIFVDTPVADVL
jgi:hypothetical protein